MNWRLISDYDKAANKVLRNRRRKTRQRHVRGRQVLNRLGSSVAAPERLGDLLTTAEAFAMIYQSLHQA